MKSYLKLYSAIVIAALAAVGTVNWLVDPLWYGQGNRLTGRNFSFNERVSKTNLLLQGGNEKYDCLILGSSRATLLKASSFKGQTCFNYAFSAGRVEEFVEYAKYAKQHGLNPEVVYVGVDATNFYASLPPASEDLQINPQPMVRSYLSLDVFLFSVRTVLGISPDPRYYDRQFESEVVENLPEFKPEFVEEQKADTCNHSKVDYYAQLRNVFPDARFVGYIPPISAWNVVNESYSRAVMDCVLQDFYAVSEVFDVLYDFSIPSEVTTNPKNTYDGSHFYPPIHDEVAQILQGDSQSFGVLVDGYELADYRGLYKEKLREFLYREDHIALW